MHIPDTMIQGPICPVTAAISTSALAVAGVAWAKSARSLAPHRFAATSALIFAAQMVNFPVASGTSGHMLGGALAVALLGLPAGMLSVALVVAVQCLMFSDGGLSVLGANIATMALVGAGVSGALLRMTGLRRGSPAYLASLAVVSWVSVAAASVACSAMLALSGTVAWNAVLPAMLGTHMLIGLGEAAMTVAVVATLGFAGDHATRKTSRTPVLLGLTAVAALVCAPFASPLPDGLESVAAQLGFLRANAPAFLGLLDGYTVPFISAETLSTAVAGLCGAAATFVLASLAAKVPALSRISRVGKE